MSVILWITMVCYISIAAIFNVMFLYVYREEKEAWTESDLCNKIGMFLASITWPIALGYGIYKLNKEKNKQ